MFESKVAPLELPTRRDSRLEISTASQAQDPHFAPPLIPILVHFPVSQKSTISTMASMKTWTVSEPYLNTHCGLGEGPYYEAATHTLRFVDIKKHRLHSLDLSIGPSSLKTLQFDMPVGVTADIEGVDPQKKILIGGKSGIYLLDREKEKWTLLKRFHDSEENDERMRSNDGAIDPKGTFWIGTMNDFWVGEPQAEGE
jgi:sugar lactone lactonase YvrE